MAQPSSSHIPEPSQTNVWLSVLGILGCFLIFGIVLITAYVPARQAAPTVDIQSIEEGERWKYDATLRKDKLTALQAKAADLSSSYGWVEQDKIVRLPIERAMQLVVQENAPKK